MKSAAVAPSRIPIHPPAPHVRAAVAAVAQPKRLEPLAPHASAAHVRSAVAQARMPAAPAAPTPQRPPADHVRTSVSQAKLPPAQRTVAPPPPPPPARRPAETVQSRPALPPALGTPPARIPRLIPQIVQPYTVHGAYKVSASTHYAVAGNSRLFIRVGVGAVAMPAVYNWAWQADGAQVTINGNNYQPYRAMQANGVGAALPSDCIKAAQIVMGGVRSAAGTPVANLDGLAEPNYAGGGSVSAPLGAQPPVGSAYLIVHSAGAGDFHTAAVILHDGTDNITLEADVGDPMTFRQDNLEFDMYNENAAGQSFWANQGGAATDRVWRVDLPNAVGGAGAGTLVGDIEDRLSNAQRTRRGQVMA